MRAHNNRSTGKNHEPIIYEYCLRRYRVVWSLNEWQNRDNPAPKKEPRSAKQAISGIKTKAEGDVSAGTPETIGPKQQVEPKATETNSDGFKVICSACKPGAQCSAEHRCWHDECVVVLIVDVYAPKTERSATTSRA